MKQLNSFNTDTTKYTIDNIIGESLSPEEELCFQFNRYVAHAIVLQRKKLQMTQEDLAAKSGVSRATISAIEKRKRIVSTEILLKLLSALNLNILFSER